MKYQKVCKAEFLERPNRFTAHCRLNGQTETVHVKNTGRCKELLTDGATVVLEESSNPMRKTKYDLIAAYKGKMLVNMDSQSSNKAALEWLRDGEMMKRPRLIKPECIIPGPELIFIWRTKRKSCLLR